MAEGVVGEVLACHSVQEWNDRFEKGKASKKLVVVDFTASWCPPCRFIGPILADLAKKMHHVMFLKVDVDELQKVAEEWEVEAMPTFIFLKEGKLMHKIMGAHKDELIKSIEKLSVDDAAAAASSSS